MKFIFSVFLFFTIISKASESATEQEEPLNYSPLEIYWKNEPQLLRQKFLTPLTHDIRFACLGTLYDHKKLPFTEKPALFYFCTTCNKEIPEKILYQSMSLDMPTDVTFSWLLVKKQFFSKNSYLCDGSKENCRKVRALKILLQKDAIAEILSTLPTSLIAIIASYKHDIPQIINV